MAKNEIIVSTEAFNDQVKKAIRESESRSRSNAGPPGRWHKKGSGGAGQIIRFQLLAPIDCEGCTAQAAVLSRPANLSSVEEEIDGEVQVADLAGCFLTGPKDDLIGAIGYATYMYHDPDIVGQLARCPFEASFNWEIFSLCCMTGDCE